MIEPVEFTSEEVLAGETLNLLRELLHMLLQSSMPAWINLQLTLPQLRTVFIIAHNRTSSIQQIAQQLGIGEPTASHLVDKLVRANLVERSDDPVDRRRVRVILSSSGEEMVKNLLGWEEFLGKRFKQISKKDLSLFQQGLAAILDKQAGS